MRLSLLSLLLLSAATPAFADPIPDEPSERAVSRAERPARVEREERSYSRNADEARPRPVERVERANRDAEAPLPPRRAERPEPRADAPEPAREIAAAAVAEQRGERWNRQAPEARGEVRQWRGDRASGWQNDRTERRTRQREIPPSTGSPVFGSAVPSPDTVGRAPRDVPPGAVAGRDLRDRIAAEGLRRDRIESAEWRQEWRNDRRYDWRRHRDRDRNRFHLSVYYDPFGWQYRDYDIGWRLPARYYTSRYWLQDPWTYRLPPVGGYYRWVRYYNDVLLVDVRNGRVLDRIRRFFW
ncbi:RcnB family protein [Sphingomonas sp. LHG3443-2]|uniref:RcnB family protein n=1 Tax=Sphingomonas sp. LHG3443-2 TaxID=2804639 RepID=UPI003CFA9941